MRLIVLLLASSLLAACGLKGDLYLPDKSSPVIITSPDQSSSSSSSSAQAAP
ncbi:MAG: lipoprotein [Steroidobacteraceae bacterium]